MMIDERFCGPPDTANGGLTAGLLAAMLNGTVEVTLRRPPPLASPLQILPDDGLVLRNGETLIAEARPSRLELDVPAAVPLDEARGASARYIWRDEGHPFPTCFVCGPLRRPGDGLRLFPGAVRGLAACVWVPDASLPGRDGFVATEIVWAALDCPSLFGAYASGHADPSPAVLGRITAGVTRRPRVGEPTIVQGWGIGRDGRKITAGSALYDADGDVLASARSVWITVG